jgi:hypothetical protein
VAKYEPPTTLNLMPSIPLDKQYEVCLEQYKAYMGDLGNIGTRYATVQGFYVSVFAALVSILALAESGKILSPLPTSTLVVVCSFAIPLCILWAATIRFYGGLFAAKFAVLKVLEANLAYNCFEEEYKVRSFDKETQKFDRKPFLTKIEVIIPIVVGFLFFALAAIRLLGH